jgi:hypothetical protein
VRVLSTALSSRQPSTAIADDITVVRKGIAAFIHEDLGGALCELTTNEAITPERWKSEI